MVAVALVLAGAAFAVATVALLVGIRAYDVALQLQAVDQNSQPMTAREPARLHFAATTEAGNLVPVHARRRASAAAERTH